jgi:hypothetical protein
LCMGIVWTEISSEEKISSMTRTKIHFWRTDLTIDLIIVVFFSFFFYYLLGETPLKNPLGYLLCVSSIFRGQLNVHCVGSYYSN